MKNQIDTSDNLGLNLLLVQRMKITSPLTFDPDIMLYFDSCYNHSMRRMLDIF